MKDKLLKLILVYIITYHACAKVIYTKYSKHRPYTVAHTIDCVCRKCYRGFLPYATFGTWKKFTLAKNRIMKAVTKSIAHKIALAKFLANDQESFGKPQ